MIRQYKDFIKKENNQIIDYSNYVSEQLNIILNQISNQSGTFPLSGSSGLINPSGNNSYKEITDDELYQNPNSEKANTQSQSVDNFGLWTKNEEKPLQKFEKWMIGIGIGTLIIGIVTIIVMLVL